jgi:signal transduction histidine kinase
LKPINNLRTQLSGAVNKHSTGSLPQVVVQQSAPAFGNFALTLMAQTTRNGLLRSAAEWLNSEIQVSLAAIYLYDATTHEFVSPVAVGSKDVDLEIAERLRIGGIYSDVMTSRSRHLLSHIVPEMRLGVMADGMQAAYVVPLASGAEFIGVLCVQTGVPELLDVPTCEMVDQVAALLSAQLVAFSRFSNSQQAIARFDRFQMLAQRLTDHLDSAQLLQEIVEAAREMLDTQMSILMDIDPDGGPLRPVAWSGIDGEAVKLLRSSLKEDLKGLVAWARQPARTSNLHTDQRTSLASHAVAAGMLSEMAVPVVHQDKLYGVLAVETNVYRNFTDEEMNLLSALASHAGVALRNAQLFENMQTVNRELEKTVADLIISQQQAENARLSALEANRLKTEFVNNMSHELRTPLNAVINFTRIVTDGHVGPVTPPQVEYLGYVHDAGQHLLGLINDILDLAKIEAGKMDLRREPTMLEPILRGVMSTAVGLTREKGLDLFQDIAPNLPMLNIDGTRIRQVLLNLLSNAAKFTPNGSITLRAERERQQVVISVRDTGIGIEAEDIPKVFEEFRQIDGSLQRTESGTGLGMPISKRFVQLHGGDMWIESAVGAGTTVYFSLPIEFTERTEVHNNE